MGRMYTAVPESFLGALEPNTRLHALGTRRLLGTLLLIQIHERLEDTRSATVALAASYMSGAAKT